MGRARRRAAVALLYVVATTWVGLEWLGVDLVRRQARPVLAIGGTTLPATVHGTAPRPYVLRTLVPTAVRLVRAAIPEAAALRWRAAIASDPRIAWRLSLARWEPEFVLEYLIAAALAHALLVAFALAMRELHACLDPTPGWRREVTALAAVLSLPFFFRVGSHFLHDPATLLFFALGLALVERRRLRLLYPLLVLAMLNKETAGLLVAVFAVRWFRAMPRRAWLAHTAALAATAAAARAFLLWVFRENPGAPFLWNAGKNLRLFERDGVDLPTVALAGLLLAAVAVRWSREHPLPKAALAALPPLAAAYALVGVYGEIRVFYEMVPAGIVWVVNGVLQVAGVPPYAGGEGRVAPVRAR